MKDKVVRIDSDLLDEVEAFIRLDANRFKYVNKKQLVDLAVSEFIAREKKRKKE